MNNLDISPDFRRDTRSRAFQSNMPPTEREALTECFGTDIQSKELLALGKLHSTYQYINKINEVGEVEIEQSDPGPLGIANQTQSAVLPGSKRRTPEMTITTKKVVDEDEFSPGIESNHRGAMTSKMEDHPQSSIPVIDDRSPLLKKKVLQARASPQGERGERAVVLKRHSKALKEPNSPAPTSNYIPEIEWRRMERLDDNADTYKPILISDPQTRRK